MTNTVPYYEDFSEIKKKIWLMLDDAVTNRSSPFRIPVFVCGDQSDFDGRIVVLRRSDQSSNILQFHSDIRSDKISKLKKNKNAALIFYDKEEKIQLRVKAECKVHFDDEITKEDEEDNEVDNNMSDNDQDALFTNSINIISREGKASTSLLQRKLQIGYNRAARIMDQLEEQGYISSANHVGKREINYDKFTN